MQAESVPDRARVMSPWYDHDVKRLRESEIQRRLAEAPAWQLQNSFLAREFRFANFVEAFAFMTSVALVAERMNHHPDWSNVYNTVKIRLSTHDVGGISDKDFDLASAISGLYRPTAPS